MPATDWLRAVELVAGPLTDYGQHTDEDDKQDKALLLVPHVYAGHHADITIHTFSSGLREKPLVLFSIPLQ
jgi:hypothetical protein